MHLPPAYLSYLLRLWKEDEDTLWRATLEEARTGVQTSFATLEELVAFLERKTGEKVCPSEGR